MLYKMSSIVVLFALFVMFAFGILTVGLSCATKPPPPVVVVDTTPISQAQATIIKLMDVNWQVALGSVLTIVGVFILLNGSSKGIAFIGAGLAAVALAGLTVTYLAWLVDYGRYIVWIMAGGIVVGFVYFLRTAADFDGDGNVDFADIRFLINNIGKKVVKVNETPKVITPTVAIGVTDVKDNTSK